MPSAASRAQRLAIAAALGSQGLLACAQTVEPVAVPVYGAPIAGEQAQAGAGWAPPFAGRGGGGDGPIGVPVYGAPLAGQPAQPVAGRGANVDAGLSAPAYGAPFPPPKPQTPDAGAADEDGGLE